MLIEILIVQTAFRKLLSQKFSNTEKNYVHEIKLYASRSLNFASITFAVVAIIIGFSATGTTFHRLDTALIMLSYAFTLFIVSYKIEVISGLKKIYWDLQQRFFNFGIVSLSIGLLLLFQTQFSAVSVVFSIMVAAIILIHIVEFINDCKSYSKESSRLR